MIRGTVFLLWLAVSVVPYGAALIVLSVFMRGAPLYWFAVGWLRQISFCVRVIGGVRYDIKGLENVPTADSMEPVILVPKHQSTWETFALPCIMPHPLAYVFKRELLLIPFFGWAMARLDMVHIDRSKRSEAWAKVAAQGRELMAKGVWVIMFPEGTRTERGSQGVYKTGASRLAVATGAKLVPIAVASGRCWPRKSFRLVPGTISVSIGKPISPEGRKPGELMQEVEQWIETEMRQLDPEAYPS